MKIAILNYSYLTPQHIDKLKKLGEVVECPNTSNVKDALERVGGAEVAIADSFEFPINREFFTTADSLKYLSLNTTGFNLVDIVAAKEKGIIVSNLPGFSTEAVAEHAIGLMFAVSRHIVLADKEMHRKPFQINPASRADDVYIGTGIRNRTMGIVGLGKIGIRIAELAQGLGMKVIAHNRSPKQVAGVEMVNLDTLLQTSDFIVLATAYGENLKQMINEAALAKVKSSAILINIARGELVDEMALARALKEKRIAGVGADVVANWSDSNPLLKFNNVVLTPHSAFLTGESLQNMADIIVANVEAYVAGKPQNVVNK